MRPEPRPLVGSRPLGEALLAAVRTAAPARPVAGFVPAVLPDPVAQRDAADRRAPAPARPVLPGPTARRLTPGAAAGDDAAPYPGRLDGALTDTEDAPADGPPDLPPGLPDWWPAQSGSWSVRDVDPFQAVREPETGDDDPDEPTRGPAPLDDAGPVLRQRVRPVRDPASGAPVARRVPFPGGSGDDAPALRQVRRPRPAGPEPAAHLHLDPHLPVLDRDPVVDLGRPEPGAHLAVPASTDAAGPPDAAPAATAAPAPAALTPEAVADHVRHALLVERERSGALADQW